MKKLGVDCGCPNCDTSLWYYLKQSFREWYWKTIPHKYRPHELWYRIKCFVWYRYTTTKPRYLGHTWCDRNFILSETMFEILSQFIEKELSLDIVDWYPKDMGENSHKVQVHGQWKWVKDEMLDIYNWYHNTWVPYFYEEDFPEVSDPVVKEIRNLQDAAFSGYDMFDEMNEQQNTAWKRYNKLENEMQEKYNEMLVRILNIREFMWT